MIDRSLLYQNMLTLRGKVVTKFPSNSYAERLGVKIGMKLVKINGEDVAADFAKVSTRIIGSTSTVPTVLVYRVPFVQWDHVNLGFVGADRKCRNKMKCICMGCVLCRRSLTLAHRSKIVDS